MGIIVALALTSAISLVGICILGYLVVSSNKGRKRRLQNAQSDSEVVQPFYTAPNHANVNPSDLPYSPIFQTDSLTSAIASSKRAGGSQQTFSAMPITHQRNTAPPEYQEGISF